MANRGLTMIGIPIWVRVPGIIVLVLVGVLASASLMGATGIGSSGGGGGVDHSQEQQQDQEIDPDDGGGHAPPGGGH